MPKGVPNPENRCKGHNRAGDQCGKPAVTGREYCRFHGGRVPVGKDHYKYKTGKYSKYLPDGLSQRYQEFLADEDLTTSINEIALLEVRIAELSEAVQKDVSQHTWLTLRKIWTQFAMAVRTGDAIKQAEVFGKLSDFIDYRTDHELNWRDLERTAESRRKLADSEQKRMVATNQMLTVEQATMLLHAMVSSIKDVVHLYADPTTAKHIITGTSEAYIALIGTPDSAHSPRTIDG